MGSVQEAFVVHVAKVGCFVALGLVGLVGQGVRREGDEFEEGRRERTRCDATGRRGRSGVVPAIGDGRP